MSRFVRVLFALALIVGAVPALFRADPADAAITAASAFKVEATRELLIGGETRNGFIIRSDSDFVSLAACTNRTCPDKPAGVRSDANDEGLRTECGTKCYVRIVNPLNGRCAVAPLEDLGPEFKNDDYWKPTAERHINLRPEYAGADIARGLPAAKRGYDGNDVGYGPGLDFRFEPISTGSGIDLGERTWSDLGLSMAIGNDYAWDDAAGGPLQMSVQMLWLTGETVAVADRACLGTQTIANIPTAGLIPGDILRVTAAGGANLRSAAGTSNSIVGVVPLDGRVVFGMRSQTVNSQQWLEVRAKPGNGWMLRSTMVETTNAGLTQRITNPTATTNTASISANTAGTTISRVTIGGNSRIKTVVSGNFSNQGPRYGSAVGLGLTGARTVVGIADVVGQLPISLGKVLVKVNYTNATSSPEVAATLVPAPVTGWTRIVTPAVVVNPALTITSISLYVLTGGTVTAGTWFTDNAVVYEV